MSMTPAEMMLLTAEDRGPAFFAFMMVLIVISTVAVALRFWSRLIIVPDMMHPRRLWWDDWTSLATLVFVFCNVACNLLMVHYGLGKHIWAIPAQNFSTLLKILWWMEMSYAPGMTLAKASALLFYQRVFCRHGGPKWFKYTLVVTHIMNVLWCIGTIMALLLMCDPISKNWDPMYPGVCTLDNTYLLAICIPHVFIDLVILILPLPIVWRLHCGPSRKIALLGVFICGYSSVVTSIGRTILLISSKHNWIADMTYASMHILYWFTAEQFVLVSICLPAMANLVIHFWGSWHVLTRRVSSLHSSWHGSSSSKRSQISDDDFDDDFYNRRDFNDSRNGLATEYKSSSNYHAYASYDGKSSPGFFTRDRCSRLDSKKIYVESAITIYQAES